MTGAEAVRLVRDRLSPVTEEAETEARSLVCALMGVEYREYPSIRSSVFPEQCFARLEEMSAARLKGVPLQYILGEWEFMGLTFIVKPCALIPRQDTETLCEEALRIGGKSVLDMCCGTGCIGISLARLGGMKAAFSDVSPRCVSLARKNARLNGIKGRFYVGSLFEKVTGRYSLICCNPPYIPTGELGSLQREVRREPALALDGGADGLEFYRCIALAYQSYLLPGGRLIMEVGMGQAKDVLDIFGRGYAVKDIQGIDRVVVV